MTGADFARYAAYIAKNAAAWSADTLGLPEDVPADIDPDRVRRFLDDMRERLDRIETAAGLPGGGRRS